MRLFYPLNRICLSFSDKIFTGMLFNLSVKLVNFLINDKSLSLVSFKLLALWIKLMRSFFCKISIGSSFFKALYTVIKDFLYFLLTNFHLNSTGNLELFFIFIYFPYFLYVSQFKNLISILWLWISLYYSI